MELLSKLSLAKIFGKIDIKMLHENGVPVRLYNVGGTVTGEKTGNSTYGEWVSFLGTFGALRFDNGQTYRAAQVFLPTIATDYLRPIAQEAMAKNETIEFGFTVGVKPTNKPDGSPSYEYTVEPIMEQKVSDPLEGMMKMLAAKAPVAALAAPEAPAQAELAVDPATETVQAEQGTSEVEAAGKSKKK